MKKQKNESILLDIQKAFHDGYMVIRFMKSILYNPIYIQKFDINQLPSLQ
jgi:hypothetical protein